MSASANRPTNSGSVWLIAPDLMLSPRSTRRVDRYDAGMSSSYERLIRFRDEEMPLGGR